MVRRVFSNATLVCFRRRTTNAAWPCDESKHKPNHHHVRPNTREEKKNRSSLNSLQTIPLSSQNSHFQSPLQQVRGPLNTDQKVPTLDKPYSQSLNPLHTRQERSRTTRRRRRTKRSYNLNRRNQSPNRDPKPSIQHPLPIQQRLPIQESRPAPCGPIRHLPNAKMEIHLPIRSRHSVPNRRSQDRLIRRSESFLRAIPDEFQ